jgi:hypothetical protein
MSDLWVIAIEAAIDLSIYNEPSAHAGTQRHIEQPIYLVSTKAILSERGRICVNINKERRTEGILEDLLKRNVAPLRHMQGRYNAACMVERATG